MVKAYCKKNAIPLLIEILFVISCFFVPRRYFIYTNFAFYLVLFLYFIGTRDLVLKDWLRSFKSGKRYWVQVAGTLAAFLAAFALTLWLEFLCKDLDTGTIGLRRDSWLTLLLFVLSTIFLPAVTEETFFRKNLILFGDRRVLVGTAAVSMFFYALEHSLTWWGIVLTMVWALPLSVAYIKTRNIHVVMTAHFIGNLLGNGADAVLTVMRFLRG